VSWDRATVAAALVEVFTAATGGAARVFDHPPETLNPMAVVVLRPQPVTYNVGALGVDQASLPVAVIGGVETEDAIDIIKGQCRKAVDADPTLGGTVLSITCTEERNWRNVTGAGGIQLLLVEVTFTILM
jgi:hypothetical protein